MCAGSEKMHRIEIRDIRAKVHIGVTEKERKRRQRIFVSLAIVPKTGYDKIEDKIDRTVNYSGVRRDVLELLKKSSYGLIETAARQIEERIAGRYSVEKLSVTVKKFPYRDTRSVSYTLEL